MARKLKALKDLKPAPYNPRTISPEALAGLKESIGQFGDVSGIVWNARSGNLVAGHQRLTALQQRYGDKLQLRDNRIITPDGEFTVRVVDWDEDKERLANITANNPAIAGEFTDDLQVMLAELGESECANLIEPLRLDELIEDPPKEAVANLKDTREVVVTCPDEAAQEDLYNRLTIEGHDVRVLTFADADKPDPLDDPGEGTKLPAFTKGVTVKVESTIRESFRVAQVRGMFDIPEQKTIAHEWKVHIPVKDDWSIGLIVGSSGSGKTTIARNIFKGARIHNGYSWPRDAAVIDGFPRQLDGAAITQALSSVGFSSPPHWLKPYRHLSNGQKFRCELARMMLEDAPMVVFDEFSSVVDRDAAKISSAAVAKAIRARGRPRLVALSCHFDIIDWLDPDWVYNVSTGEFARRSLRRRPAIELRISKTTAHAWRIFSGHHYLSRTIHRAAQCFVATWNGTPVAFTSALPLVHAHVKNTRREHRTVVLPDYQGVGIGNAISEWLGTYLRRQKLAFRSTTSHPAMIRHRMKSPKWKMIRFGRAGAQGKTSNAPMRAAQSAHRLTASFEYLGEELNPEPRISQAAPDRESARSGPGDSPAASTTGLRRKPRRSSSRSARNRPARQLR